MRSAVLAAAFAANVLAVPFQKPDEVIVTDIEVVWQTDIVTVTAGDWQTVTAAAAAEQTWGHWGHSWGHWPSSSTESTTSVSSVYVPPPAPTTTSTTSVYVPPPAPTTTSTTSVYVPPPAPTTTSTTSEYVPPPAPTTTSTTETPVYTPPPATSTYVAPPPPSTTAAPVNTWTIPTGDVATGTTAIGAPVTWTSTAAYTGYSDAVVIHHNLHRSNHSKPDVTWNETLAKSAQDIADSCIYEHNTEKDGGGYGQNIAAGVDQNNVSFIITELFYNGEVNWYNGLYNQSQPDMTNFEHWGHFSQIVWGNTTSVGCATSNCTANGLQGVGSDTPPFFTVCNYFPSGNWANEYGDNIGSPVWPSRDSVFWDSV